MLAGTESRVANRIGQGDCWVNPHAAVKATAATYSEELTVGRTLGTPGIFTT